VVETADGMEITGVERLRGCAAESFGDHRIAMSMMVAGLAAQGETTVSDIDCIATSFPGFRELLQGVVVR
jgi:3-phosphoshikimate 1-carboxyvinyltransferase